MSVSRYFIFSAIRTKIRFSGKLNKYNQKTTVFCGFVDWSVVVWRTPRVSMVSRMTRVVVVLRVLQKLSATYLNPQLSDFHNIHHTLLAVEAQAVAVGAVVEIERLAPM